MLPRSLDAIREDLPVYKLLCGLDNWWVAVGWPSRTAGAIVVVLNEVSQRNGMKWGVSRGNGKRKELQLPLYFLVVSRTYCFEFLISIGNNDGICYLLLIPGHVHSDACSTVRLAYLPRLTAW